MEERGRDRENRNADEQPPHQRCASHYSGNCLLAAHRTQLMSVCVGLLCIYLCVHNQFGSAVAAASHVYVDVNDDDDDSIEHDTAAAILMGLY